MLLYGRKYHNWTSLQWNRTNKLAHCERALLEANKLTNSTNITGSTKQTKEWGHKADLKCIPVLAFWRHSAAWKANCNTDAERFHGVKRTSAEFSYSPQTIPPLSFFIHGILAHLTTKKALYIGQFVLSQNCGLQFSTYSSYCSQSHFCFHHRIE